MDLIVPETLGEAATTRNSKATYYDINGLLVSAPANTVRYGYSVKELRNFVKQSANFKSSEWSKFNCTVADITSADPFGIAGVQKVMEDATTGTHFMDQSVPFECLRTYTRTAYFKAAERSSILLEFYPKPTAGASQANKAAVVFNASTGVFSSPSVANMTQSYSAENVGNGWWRVRQTVRLNVELEGVTDGYYRFVMLNAAGSNTFTGDIAAGIFLFGPQWERGETASAYISTPVTRLRYPVVETTSITNHLPFSDMYPAWHFGAHQGTDFFPYAGTAPDGSMRAVKMVEDSANTYHYYTSSGLTVESAPEKFFSVYVKPMERTKLAIEGWATSQLSFAQFDLDTGAITGQTGAAANGGAKIEYVFNGWWRVGIKVGAATGFRLVLLNSANTSLYQGDGHSGIMMWGFQLEAGSDWTSYVQSEETFNNRNFYSATYYNSQGYVAYSGEDGQPVTVPRETYNPELLTVPPKLLVELATINFAGNGVNTVDTDTMSQGTKNVTNSGTSVDTPLGVQKNDIRYTSSTSDGWISFPCSIPSSLYTAGVPSKVGFSVWIRSSTAKTINLYIINPSNGSTISQRAVNIKTTWSRVYCAATLNQREFTVQIGGGGTWNTASGAIDLFGTQVEVLPTGRAGYSSYKRVSSSSGTGATRGADVFTQAIGSRAADTNFGGLLYSNVPENDYPAWSASTAYSANTTVIAGHKIYTSLQSSTGVNPTTNNSSPPYWSLMGPTNKYAMVDSQVGTQTKQASYLEAQLFVPVLDSVCFLNIEASLITVQVRNSENLVIYNKSADVSGAVDGVQITDIAFTDIPTTRGGCVWIYMSSAIGDVKVGNIVLGSKFYIGSTETSPTIGIVDYSVKTVDAFGNPTLTPRPFSKRMNAKALLDTNRVDLITRKLASIRAKPCVWNGNNSTGSQSTSLIVYGYYKDFEIEIAWTTKSYLNVTIEGLI